MRTPFHGLHPDRSPTALLVLDMISDFCFPDGDPVARAARRIVPRALQLEQRVRGAGFSVLYVNDNSGRWRSDGAAVSPLPRRRFALS